MNKNISIDDTFIYQGALHKVISINNNNVDIIVMSGRYKGERQNNVLISNLLAQLNRS